MKTNGIYIEKMNSSNEHDKKQRTHYYFSLNNDSAPATITSKVTYFMNGLHSF